MKQTFSLAIILASLASPAFAQGYAEQQAAYSNASTSVSKPLMIIRFNQRQVLYKQSLYQTLARALDVVPDAKFELVSFMPPKGGKQKLGEVVQTLQSMGLNQTQYVARTEIAPHGEFEEIHIYPYR